MLVRDASYLAKLGCQRESANGGDAYSGGIFEQRVRGVVIFVGIQAIMIASNGRGMLGPWKIP